MALSCLNAGPFLQGQPRKVFVSLQWVNRWIHSEHENILKNQNNFVCQVNSDKWKKEKENFNQIVSAVNCYHYPLQPIDKDILPNDCLLKKKKER